MAVQDTSRRLSSKTITEDVESYNGLAAVSGYQSPRTEASPESLQQNLEDMQAKQKEESRLQALLKAASDEAKLAEWTFHNSILAMKEVIKGQFGSDSNEAQSIGLKKKSERKRPTRQKEG